MPNEPLQNWAGNVHYTAQRLSRPESIDELQALIVGSPRVRALGTRHSFSPIADTVGELVSVAGLPQTVDVDTARQQVRVAAGLRYGEVIGRLQSAGFALPNLGSLPHISIAGACATGTHGSGNQLGVLATAVSALDMIIATGDMITLNREDNPLEFPGAVVGLGALGVVTSLTLDLLPSFDVEQYVYEGLPRDQLAIGFDEIFDSVYSLSLFTDWRSAKINQAWLRRRVDPADSWTPQHEWLGARPADGPRHPVHGMDATACTQQLGVPGPWNKRLPCFRLEFTPSHGDELQSEYLLPREHATDALAALDAMRDKIAPVLHISEIRTIAADDLWMSPAYGRASVAIHFTWRNEPRTVAAVVAEVEARLAPFGARPHWGKLFTTSPETIHGLYERLPDFRRLVGHYDPKGKFGNAMLDRYVHTDDT